MSEPASVELDALCRETLTRRRLEAFDNIDVAALLAPERLSIASAQHLVLNGHSLEAYREGQQIIQLAAPAAD